MTGTNRSQEGGRANHHPLKHGVEPGDVRTFEDFLGASPTNVAVTAGRYGWRVAAAVNWVVGATTDANRRAVACATRARSRR